MRTSPSLTNQEAWKQAAQKCWAARQSFPTLAKLLEMYLSFTGSTSEVERIFSLAQWSMQGRRCLEKDHEDDFLVLISDKFTEDDLKELLPAAQEVWCEAGYGQSRAPYKTHKVAQSSRKRKFVNSEKQWIEKRRHQVEQMLVDSRKSKPAIRIPKIKRAVRAWSDGHVKDGWTAP